MMVRSAIGGAAGKISAALPVLTISMICCMIFSAAVCAAPEAETSAEPVVKEEITKDVVSELEVVLKKNNKCLRCHSRDKSKTLEDGEELSLQVHKEDYISSAHGEIACIGCHEAIGNRRHPSKKTNITIASQRDYSLELNQSCRNCHDKNFKQYEGSIHASLVAQGNKKAPLCTDCHSAHAIETMANFDPVNGLPCKQCHENIYNAYTESVHGEARINGNVIRDSHIQAPICSDCHLAHEVTALAIGDTIRSTCIGCHENVILLHNQWLPNAGTHLEIVSCAVCHAPFAKRTFDFHLYDNVTGAPVTQPVDDELVQQKIKAIDESDGSMDPVEIWKTTGGSVNQGQATDISLRSRMEVRSGISAHQIAGKSFAVRTCDSCHQQKSRLNQNVTVSIPQSDGTIQRVETDRESLSSVDAVNSISDFYALGGNPSKFLDILVLLSLLAGFAVPIGHFTMGKMIKELKEKGER